MTHRNAPLSIEGRRRLVERCQHRPISHVAAEMGISRACASKWVRRYRIHGELDLHDLSSIPHRQPTATSTKTIMRIEQLRRTRKWSAARIAHELAGEDVSVSVNIRCSECHRYRPSEPVAVAGGGRVQSHQCSCSEPPFWTPSTACNGILTEGGCGAAEDNQDHARATAARRGLVGPADQHVAADLARQCCRGPRGGLMRSAGQGRRRGSVGRAGPTSGCYLAAGSTRTCSWNRTRRQVVHQELAREGARTDAGPFYAIALQ